MGVNYFSDPASLFHEDYELGIAEKLTKGYHVTNVYNHNERLLQKKVIQNSAVCPETIVLGSSRGMMINKSLSQSPSLSFYNNSMSGSVLEDNIAIYELYELRGCSLKEIIISLDPWILNDNNGEERWKGLENEYASFLAKLYNTHQDGSVLDLGRFGKYSELISFSYFKSSVHYLLKGMGRDDARATKIPQNPGLTRLNDGSVTWDAQFRNAPQSTVDRRARDIVAVDPIEFLGDFDHLSVRYKKLLIDFVSYLQNKKITVKFLLTPFHPVVYSAFMKKKDYRNVLASEVFFNELAKTKGIEVYGSFDPGMADLDNSDFYDGFHCKGQALVKIMKLPSMSGSVH